MKKELIEFPPSPLEAMVHKAWRNFASTCERYPESKRYHVQLSRDMYEAGCTTTLFGLGVMMTAPDSQSPLCGFRWSVNDLLEPGTIAFILKAEHRA